MPAASFASCCRSFGENRPLIHSPDRLPVWPSVRLSIRLSTCPAALPFLCCLGFKHACRISRVRHKRAATIKICCFPGLPPVEISQDIPFASSAIFFLTYSGKNYREHLRFIPVAIFYCFETLKYGRFYR